MITASELSENPSAKDYICKQYNVSSTDFLGIGFLQGHAFKAIRIIEGIDEKEFQNVISKDSNLVFTTDTLLINSETGTKSVRWDEINHIDMNEYSITLITDDEEYKIVIVRKNRINIRIIKTIFYMVKIDDRQRAELRDVENMPIIVTKYTVHRANSINIWKLLGYVTIPIVVFASIVWSIKK